MAQIQLTSQVRTKSGKGVARQLRLAGSIPAVLYGGKHGNISLSVNTHDLRKIMINGVGSHLINLDVTQNDTVETIPVILKDYQLDPASRALLHADFYEVTMDHAIEIHVPIELTGTSPGVKLGGVVSFATREITLACLPKDILDTIHVDISALEIGDSITVKDIALGDQYKMVTPTETVIVTIAAPVSEASLETTPQEGPVEPEVIQKGKKEVEEE